MALTKIQGHTYYYPGATNVGVVRFKNGMALLVDAGIDSTAGRALAQAVEAEGLKPKYLIVTHAHPDHFGAAKWLREQYAGLTRYAPPGEVPLLEHPRLESQALYGASPLRELEGRFLKGPAMPVDVAVPEGDLEIGEKRLRIISLPGHTYGQAGVLTGDGVLFAGDSLFSEEIMAKYGFPFLLDVEQQLATIGKLEALNPAYLLLAHASGVLTGAKKLCQQNRARIDEYLAKILEWCDQPLTREDLTEQVIMDSRMEADVAQYQMTWATVGAFLSYLANRGQLAKSMIGGKLYFYRE